MGGWLKDNTVSIAGLVGAGGIVAALAMVGDFIAASAQAAALLAAGAFLVGVWAGSAWKGLEAERERRDYGDLPPAGSLPRDCMQLLCEMEDGAVHRVGEAQVRRRYAAGLLEEDGYVSMWGFGGGFADYRLTNDARRVMAARRREWDRAKKAAGVPDDSVFADDLERLKPSLREQVRASGLRVL